MACSGHLTLNNSQAHILEALSRSFCRSRSLKTSSCEKKSVLTGSMKAAVLNLVVTTAFIMISCVQSYSCHNDEDCELLGQCLEQTCKCDRGWQGPSCGTLRLGDAIHPHQGIWPLSESHSDHETYSWGFSVTKVGDVFHGWANQGCYNNSIGMVSGTFLYHVTSYVDPTSANPGGFTGNFIGNSIVMPASSFNPHIVYSSFNKQYTMFFRINGLDEGFKVCVGNKTDFQYKRSSIRNDQLTAKSMDVAVSDSPYGPWTVSTLSIANINPKTHISNPSALQLENGTWIMAYRWNGGQEHVGIATSRESTSPVGPYYNIANLSTPGEDPFIWQNAKGLHLLFHVENEEAYQEWPSLHAWAPKDDLTRWNVSNSFAMFGEGAYSTNVKWSDGSTERFYRRERPEIMFDANGYPQWFFSAVQEMKKPNEQGFPFSYSVAQMMY